MDFRDSTDEFRIIRGGASLSTVSELKALASRDAVSALQKQKLVELQAVAEKYKTEPGKMKSKTNELIKQWSTDALSRAGDAAIDNTLEIVETVFHLNASN